MAGQGVLQGVAQAELAALVKEIARDYRPGALESAARDPAWQADVERAEREVAALYAALGDADAVLSRWQEAVTNLRGVWRRVGQTGAAPERRGLEDVA